MLTQLIGESEQIKKICEISVLALLEGCSEVLLGDVPDGTFPHGFEDLLSQGLARQLLLDAGGRRQVCRRKIRHKRRRLNELVALRYHPILDHGSAVEPLSHYYPQPLLFGNDQKMTQSLQDVVLCRSWSPSGCSRCDGPFIVKQKGKYHLPLSVQAALCSFTDFDCSFICGWKNTTDLTIATILSSTRLSSSEPWPKSPYIFSFSPPQHHRDPPSRPFVRSKSLWRLFWIVLANLLKGGHLSLSISATIWGTDSRFLTLLLLLCFLWSYSSLGFLPSPSLKSRKSVAFQCFHHRQHPWFLEFLRNFSQLCRAKW